MAEVILKSAAGITRCWSVFSLLIALSAHKLLSTSANNRALLAAAERSVSGLQLSLGPRIPASHAVESRLFASEYPLAFLA